MNKYLIFIIILISSSITLLAQDDSPSINSITMESGVNLSQFDFSNSDVESAFKNGDYSPSLHQAISIGFKLKGDLNLFLGAAYDKYQIVGKPIDMASSHLSYDISYASANAGLNYTFPVQNKVSLLISAGLSYDYLISGFQNIGSATYDLEDTYFQKTSYSYNAGAGLIYHINNITGVYVKYDYRKSFDMDETDPNNTYTIKSYMYSLGVKFKLNN
jgi:opacity protein-like surface antigen